MERSERVDDPPGVATLVPPPPGGVRRDRRGGAVVLWAMTATCLGWGGLRMTGWEPVFRWSQAVSFTPYLAVAALVPLAWAALTRRWRAALTAFVAVAMFAVIMLPRMLPGAQPPARGPALRVMTLNMWNGNVPISALMEQVRRYRPDVLTLQEVTGPVPERLAAEGMAGLLPYAYTLPEEDANGVAIYARHPMSEGRRLPGTGPGQAAAMVTMPDGRRVEIVSVHACAPSSGWRTACWEPSVRRLPGAGGPLRVLAGDFNATLDHAVLRGLIATGYRDAADATGHGLTMTWPYHEQPFFFPKIAIDHVLADERIAVRDFRAVTLPGDDHRLTVTDLTLP
ncbi:endonuclease/exonuclease/phosphatase family protein [Spongiactinospora sp. 9N601]|uniref:endonuclease/exonuclease/phosphatase family protein n=1 Tax=Spongiactinospora sp. 9N601 TaxID=3375149 RepID=UPI003796744B